MKNLGETAQEMSRARKLLGGAFSTYAAAAAVPMAYAVSLGTRRRANKEKK